jgi:gliding motility-associated-like protein
MQGIFIPTAFTPNNDGLNDVFKAVVFGKVVSFKLQVYSREGQLIFQTTDPLKGWDGFYKNGSYATTAFVWQCSYQIENRQPEYQKGTVILIR